MMKKTKIVCTVGPSTDQPGILEAMLDAGMNVARFNFSHGTHTEQGERILKVRAAAKAKGLPVALMLDTKGPEMRLGLFADEKVTLEQGQKFILTSREVSGTKEISTVNHALLPQEVTAGDLILLSDGLVSLRVETVVGDEIHTTVLNTGSIGNRKRVAAPGVSVNLPPLSEQDIADVRFGVKEGLDFIAASFIQRGADILAIRKVLEEAGSTMQIISKIENAQGVKNIDEIIALSDGIMVARGDLGVEIPTEEVPLVQKMIIEKCNEAGKPVITATQMLESMIVNPRPTRAEASDVANAIMDGTDAIMLSGETASGKYPIEAVAMMEKIAIRTEAALAYQDILRRKGLCLNNTMTDAISHATVQIAQQLEAAAIITTTQSGYTPRMVSKYRPQAAIIAVTPHEKTARAMQLLWGVQVLVGTDYQDTDEMVKSAVNRSLEAGLIKEGDLAVITAGVPAGLSGNTNLIRVCVVGQILLRGTGIGQSVVTGTVKVIRSASDWQSVTEGDILVLAGLEEEQAALASKAKAILCEEGGLTSNAAIVGIHQQIPVIVGVDHALELLQTGNLVTVDAARGLVYQGEIKAK
ncbi:MAG: pyruvate kinase [Sporomusaceae bacterium]|nr:pyruvate kinase [Sporomusaceae bacterium]